MGARAGSGALETCMVYRVGVRHISEFLRGVDIFQGLSDRNLDRIAGLCEEAAFRAGDYLGIQNDQGTHLHIIRKGEFTITTGFEGSTVVVRSVVPYETLHLSVLFEPPLLVTTAQAATDGEAWVIPRVRLMELCELEPTIGMHVYRAACGIVIRRYRHTLDRLG